MRIATVIALLVFGLSTTSTTFAQSIPKPEKQTVSGKIAWVYDYEKGKEFSAKTGKPMFVVFRCER